MRDALTALPALAPAAACVALGALTSPLWLDEILYYYLQGDRALRAAEIGRPTSALAPFFSNYFFCDLQRIAQGLLAAAGVTFAHAPEVVLRALPLASFLATCLVLQAVFRRSGASRLDAALGCLVFSSMPLVLYYAFEARVYAFTAFLVVVLLALLARPRERCGPLAAAGFAALGLFTAHTQLWTLCVFGALALDAGVRVLRNRIGPDVVARLAASLPALALIGSEYLYMKATDPGRPVYPPFLPQPLGLTAYQLLVSNFSGPTHLQYVVLKRLPRGEILAICGVFLLVALAALAWRSGGAARRREIAIAVGALALCGLVAVTFGYFQHARYHLPLVAALLLALGPPRGTLARGISGALLLVNLILLPEVVEEMDRKSDGRRLAEYVAWRFPDLSKVALIFQNTVTGGYQLPTYSIATDLYLNVLHPERPPVSLHEFPALARIDGRRGVYDLFAAGPEGLRRILEVAPDAWARRLRTMPPNLLIVHPIWGIPGSQEQIAGLLHTIEADAARKRTATLSMNGFPHLFVAEYGPAAAAPARGP